MAESEKLESMIRPGQGVMFFEVPDWNVGKPVSEEELIAARKEEAKKLRGSKPQKRVSFADGETAKNDTRPTKKAKKSVKPVEDFDQPETEPAPSELPKRESHKTISAPKATDETSKLKAKLSGARFRFLNQKLYESDSISALNYFQEHQDDFIRYHEGFQEQTKRWPTNPVDVFIKDLASIVRKSTGSLVVADLGCGEGKLGLETMALAQKEGKKGVKVHSFDLVAVGDHVKVASMTAVPLPKHSVDYVIFSLSLMNTDFSKALIEANRILRPNGHLWIAEIESRFDGGFSGVEGFVRQLKQLGFQIQGQPDLSYRVFVLMRFSKTKQVDAVPTNMKLKACMYKKR